MADGGRISFIDRACIVVPAYQAEASLRGVIDDLRAAIPERSEAIFVIDDGSRDATATIARSMGCAVVSHGTNRGKGAALRTGLATAAARGFDVALTVDADGQHPAFEARRVLFASADPHALVLGIRDLEGARAPKANRFSNGISNFFLSRFAGRPLADTQCGLRRYPIHETLALGARGDGYDFEAEVLLRAVWSGATVVEQDVRVLYPEERVTHFHVARDPWRIIKTVLATLADKNAKRR
jgi:glycosyltransferase involved in cell wall biosynthesis